MTKVIFAPMGQNYVTRMILEMLAYSGAALHIISVAEPTVSGAVKLEDVKDHPHMPKGYDWEGVKQPTAREGQRRKATPRGPYRQKRVRTPH